MVAAASQSQPTDSPSTAHRPPAEGRAQSAYTTVSQTRGIRLPPTDTCAYMQACLDASTRPNKNIKKHSPHWRNSCSSRPRLKVSTARCSRSTASKAPLCPSFPARDTPTKSVPGPIQAGGRVHGQRTGAVYQALWPAKRDNLGLASAWTASQRVRQCWKRAPRHAYTTAGRADPARVYAAAGAVLLLVFRLAAHHTTFHRPSDPIPESLSSRRAACSNTLPIGASLELSHRSA